MAERSSSHRRHSPSDRDRDHHRHHDRHHHRRTHTHEHRHDRKRKRSPERAAKAPPVPIVLPMRAAPLSKRDLANYHALFASYLDIQKQLILEDLTEEELKGRWKSFVGKWNRGELAEGWYDPSMKAKADEAAAAEAEELARGILDQAPSGASRGPAPPDNLDHSADDKDDDSDDGYGPAAPPAQHAITRAGPNPASFSDLALRDELDSEHAAASREALRAERKADRALQRSRLDELAPRAEPGTRERQLEKKREAGAAARSYREGRAGAGEVEEVGDGELMGGGADVRQLKTEQARRKNEREMRKEEVLRARAAEREKRLKGIREKEEKSMETLRAIARERFGGVEGQ